MSDKSRPKPEPTFEEAYAQLQAVLRELNDSQVPLDKLVEKYSRARTALEVCRKRLGEAELEVKKLGKNGLEDFEE
jgi:exodeoxyribonuclease VII small subunit